QKTLAQLEAHEKRVSIDAFAAALSEILDPKSKSERTRDHVLLQAGQPVGCKFDVRQFDNFLFALGEAGLLNVFQRTNAQLEEEIQRAHHVRSVRVVAGDIPSRFAQVSAELFMSELDRIGRH